MEVHSSADKEARLQRFAPGSVVAYTIAIIVALAMIGLPLAFVASKHLASPNLWFDESGQCWLSLGLHQFTAPRTPHGSWGDILRYGRVMNADPGAFTFLLRFWMGVFGFSPLALRSLPFLFFLLMPVVIVLSALRCGANPVFAVLAGSIPLGFPMMLNYATEVRAYSMEACAVAFLFFLPCWLTDERRDRMVTILGCVAALLVASRYSAFIFGAAACLTALLPLRPLRAAVVRALRFGVPVLISAAAAYLLFARYQVNGSHQAPFYVEPLLLHGKNAAAQLALLRENFLGSDTLPITLFLIAAPLFFWLGPRSLTRLRSLVGRTAVFCALSVTLTALASLAGVLPWAVHTRWSIGYQSLSACCLAMIIVAVSICLCQEAAAWPRKTLVIAAATCFAVAWSLQLRQAVRVERPYYETIASHLKGLAGLPNAKELKFFIHPNAAPTVRYLCELGPFRGAFSYPARFHFESEPDVAVGAPISANEYDIIVLTHTLFADAYRARVVGGKTELEASPGPSCLLVLKK